MFVRHAVATVASLVLVAASFGTASAQTSRRRTPPAAAAPEPAPEAAPAEPAPDSARDLFGRGQAAYQQGDYAAAAEMWERAFALEPRPALQYNLAQAYGRQGRLEDEQAALRRFVDAAPPTDPQLVSARARLATIEQRLSRTGILIQSDSYEGAVVLVDGADRGRLPHPDPLSLRPGSHTLDVRLEGYLPFHAAVVVPAGETVSVTVVMQESAVTESHPMRLPIILYATGGALVVTGAILGGLAFSKAGGALEGSPDADKAHSMAIAADVSIGVGVAAAATGLVFHLLRRKSHGDAPSATAPAVSVNPGIAPGRYGLVISGRF